MPEYQEIIWTVNASLLGWILTQYFKLRKEINLINVGLVKNYATNEALEKLIESQNKMLDALTDIKIDQATMFERIDRYHAAETIQAVQAEQSGQGSAGYRAPKAARTHR